MYDSVLFPTDGSDATNRARRHALDIAGQYGATLHVLSVVADDPYRGDEAEASAAASAERAVEAVAEDAAEADVDAVTEVRGGTPHETILAYADENDVDMIVMGTHGRTGVGRALIGSVTERVVRTADVPVVTVRMTDEPSVGSAEDAEAVALAELRDRGVGDATVTDEPYRTTGSWIVPAESDGETVHVHIDAVSGSVRVARLGD